MQYRKAAFLVLLTGLLLLTPISGQTETPDFGDPVLVGDLQVGILTNAPSGMDPLTYSYNEEMHVELYVLDPESPNRTVSVMILDLQASRFDDQGEVMISLQTIHYSSDLQVKLQSIAIGGGSIELSSQNVSQAIFSYDVGDSSALTLDLQGSLAVTSMLQQQYQGSVTFTSFTPRSYEVGPVSIEQWQSVLPILSLDMVLLPLITVFAALYIYIKAQSSRFSTAAVDIETQAEQVKEEVDSEVHDDIDEMTEAADKIIDQTDSAEDVAEVADTAMDVVEARDSGTSEKIGWIHRPFTVGIIFYLVLLAGITARLFYSLPSQIDDILLSVHLVFTSIFLVLLLLYTLLSYLRPSVLKSIGTLIPLSHVLFSILGLGVFVVLVFFEILDVVPPTDLETGANLVYLWLTGMSFIVASLFAGYYLARSGKYMIDMVGTFTRRRSYTRGLRQKITRFFTIIFLVIILVRVVKLLALVLLYLDLGILQENAYVVTLAGLYLSNEAIGPAWYVYGFMLIFFAQALLAIFLHLNREHVPAEPILRSTFQAYRRFALLLAVGVSAFIHLVVFYRGNLELLGLDTFIYAGNEIATYDAYLLLHETAPFKLLLDVLLFVGLFITLPLTLKKMWDTAP